MTNIIKCTIKKSVSVTKKLAKWASIGAGILAGIAIFAYLIWLIRDVLVATWNAYVNWNAFWWSVIEPIPWFVWIILAIPCSIVVYSYLWCYTKQHPGFITKDVFYGLVLGIVGFIGFGLMGAFLYLAWVSEFSTPVCIFVWFVFGALGGILWSFLGYYS